jgi:hypothetical protein
MPACCCCKPSPQHHMPACLPAAHRHTPLQPGHRTFIWKRAQLLTAAARAAVCSLLHIARCCQDMPAEQFRVRVVSYVDDLEELRKQVQEARVRALFTRLLFILARCSRLLVSDGPGGGAGAGSNGAGAGSQLSSSLIGAQTVDRLFGVSGSCLHLLHARQHHLGEKLRELVRAPQPLPPAAESQPVYPYALRRPRCASMQVGSHSWKRAVSYTSTNLAVPPQRPIQPCRVALLPHTCVCLPARCTLHPAHINAQAALPARLPHRPGRGATPQAPPACCRCPHSRCLTPSWMRR